ncbi:MAG: NAD(P)-dependent oxidoreductase [Mangrovibacterium sp.]
MNLIMIFFPNFRNVAQSQICMVFFGQPVAESAIAGILSLKRGLDKLAILKEQKEWMGSALRPGLTTVSGVKVLIAGGGNIGQSIKKLLSGFDAKTVIYDKTPEVGDISLPEEFDRELPDAEVVISCLPEAAETKHFFNKRRFDLMCPTTIFVNLGRGGVVDETVLIKYLYDMRIAGAVLDVTAVEPVPREHILWNCPNTIITQHTGGGSRKELTGKVVIFLDNLARYLSGRQLTRIVQI